MKLFQNIKKKLLYLLTFLLFAGIGFSALFFFNQYRATTRELSLLKVKAQENPQTENTKIINTVSKIFELPSAAPDAIVPIKDKAPLKDQPFFDQAKVDDILLVYVQAKKAILYRPSTNKIVDVAPVNLTPAGPSQVSGAVAGASTGIIPSITPLPVNTKNP